MDGVFNLQDKIISEGLKTVTVKPMGGNLVLIMIEEGEDFTELLKIFLKNGSAL